MTTSIKPMKLTDVGPEAAYGYITNNHWIMQQKLDGARVMVHCNLVDGQWQFLWTNDGVKPIAFSAAKLKIPTIELEMVQILKDSILTGAVFDGELLIEEGIYWIFDIVESTVYGQDSSDFVISPSLPLHRRLRYLGRLIESEHVRQSPIAITYDEKADLWDLINETGVEGAVSKLNTSTYEGGTRSKDWVKHKLVKTADVVVTGVTRIFDHKEMVTHGSAELAVPIKPTDDPAPWVNAKGRRLSHEAYEELQPSKRAAFGYVTRLLLPIGSASLIGKETSINVGSVVEIDYLYWTGSAPVQPRIMRQRWDKNPEECDFSQFPQYTRRVLSV